VTVREIVDLLLKATGSELQPDIRADQPVPMLRRVGSSERAKRELGWQPDYELEEGLRDVVARA
jgi:nucleoside-diphosphate-sugar epimerase